MAYVEAHARRIGIGQQLTIVREIALDATIDEHGVVIGHHDLVLRQGDGQRVVRTRQGGKLLQERAGDNSLEALGRGLAKLSLGDGKAIGVGCHHLQRLALERDEHAGEDGAALILGNHACHALDHRRELGERNGDSLLRINMRESREVLGIQRLDGERRSVARDDGGILARFNMHGSVGQVLHDVEEQLAGKYRAALLFHQGGDGELNGQLQVGCLQRQVVVMGIKIDTRKNGQRGTGGNALEHNGERILQFRLVDAEFHWLLFPFT